ncbi:MAG: aminoglycoside phosphotransferase family protein, partial [Rhodothermia bacterium]|nr:aminoglycoside phosphotransferase family protein [Rhodothermia bacterium]
PIVLALKSGYLAGGGRLGSSLSALTAVVLLHLASTPFRRGDGDWPDQMSRILDRCDQLLGIGEGKPGTARQAERQTDGRPATSTSEHEERPMQPGGYQEQHDAKQKTDVNPLPGLESPDRFAPAMPARPPSSPPSGHSRSSDPMEKELLSRALDADYVGGLLRSGRTLPTADVDSAAVTITSAEIVKHRSGKRFVVAYGREGDESDLIGKVRLKGVNRRSYRVMRDLHDLGFAAGAGRSFAVPQPFAILDELNMTLYRKVDAGCATDALLTDRGEDMAWRIGRGLASLHTVRALTDRHHTVPEEIAILTKCFNQFRNAHPDQADRASDILSRCRHLVSDTPYSLTAIHRDFHPENVLVDGQQVYIIDFDLYSLGDPAIDAGNFIGHLVELGIRNYEDPDALDGLVRAFRAGYRDADGPADRRRIQSFATLTLARHIYLSTVRPGRSSTTETLMACCERRLRRAAAA